MADSTTRHPPSTVDSRLSKFLDEYPIPLHYSLSYGDTYAFWSHENEPTQHDSSSDDPGFVPHSPDDLSEIHHKLRQLFRSYWIPRDGLIQFWSIVETGSRCLLATDNQPFLLKLDSGFQEYRLRSHKYQYNIDPDNLEDEEDRFIINGAPANVFRSHLAELIPDPRFHQGDPLVRYALECGLMSCFLIPLCHASQSRCVGVLEYCTRDYDNFLQNGYDFLISLKGVGLRAFNVQKDLLYKSIGNLEETEHEIRAALKMAYQLHTLTFAQASITSEDKNLVKQMVALTMITKFINDDDDDDDDDYDYDYDYCTYCDMLPMKIMDRLAGKALKNYEPHSCKNIMGNIEQPATITMKKYSCLVICLRSSLTGDHVDYVFEFLWPPEELCYRSMILRLISTLIGCLPNFKFASGAKFGDDQLRVIDVGNLSESGIQTTLEFFKGKGKTHGISSTLDQTEQQNGRTMEVAATNLNGEKLSPIPEVVEEGRKRKDGKGKTHEISLTLHEIKQQYGRTMEEAATNLNVSKSTLKRKWKNLNIGSWPGPKGGKRKVNNSYKDQSDNNERDNREAPLVDNVDVLTIKVEYQNDLIKFRLPLSSITVEAIEKEIDEKFKLNAGSFKLKYRDEEGDWILLESAQDMRLCIESSRILNSTLRLRVE